MITISLCMIVRDEEDVIERCLGNARQIADEMILVDTGSTDRTKEIAIACGAKVYDFEWIDDFAAARNASFEKATMDYILWLDADDVIEEDSLREFLRLKETLDPDTDVVMMRYHVAFDEKGNPTYTFMRERLLKRSSGFRWGGRVHEAIVPLGKVKHSDIAIRHSKVKAGDPQRNIKIYERMIAEGETLEPRHQYYYARELFSNGRNEEAIILLRRFIEHPGGWIENRIGACRDLASCLMKLEDHEEALKALTRSFAMGEPRAEICCDIGGIFLKMKNYSAAIFWYKSATECAPSETGGGFAMPECRGYIPYLQLCLCYDHLGDYETAEMYNEKAAALKEGDAATLQNREYFRVRREKQEAMRQ